MHRIAETEHFDTADAGEAVGAALENALNVWLGAAQGVLC